MLSWIDSFQSSFMIVYMFAFSSFYHDLFNLVGVIDDKNDQLTKEINVQ